VIRVPNLIIAFFEFEWNLVLGISSALVGRSVVVPLGRST